MREEIIKFVIVLRRKLLRGKKKNSQGPAGSTNEKPEHLWIGGK